ncbi:MAG: class I poly(R)-hydroxyalkanoic acid synthase [Candidatus Dactylopiibacterium carminicum]|uniref:Class I poly(R)-hydroxyalkanoic acid synthase n=2 Tax=Candidatus Dactylopiibacterium carminicum TaxID=857335 RepID=A0A272EUA9_9RHOO|nr:class I poly(R)-hydroxyalkanoic acid synthase [Candidatus Dactylopiibacterium carminicum]PAS93677.1 MAG: class I poly(R)-hydroxyalkanoic acid synthase [Candidatus Dactylopiibacterium carminicum]PAS97545.1 MAG: class I poly(R)-hydroxyalkanoic acid synthase [Candidatus Dactylopiibacterium carminicum]
MLGKVTESAPPSNLAGFPAFGGAAAPGLENDEIRRLQREHAELHGRLWRSMAQRKPGVESEPIVSPGAGDRRFNAPEWSSSPLHDYMRQAYLINANFLTAVADALPITDKVAKSRLQFMTRQYVDALAPSNFLASNPEVVQKALDTKGESLSKGLLNLIGDVEKGRISMTDDAAFEVGGNLATTEGAVIFENELMQLIQYAPLTEKVSKQPLLIVPPNINKYYILDLQAENSFVRYAVEQGITVFLISWRNPGAAQAQLGWDDYLDQGILLSLQIVRTLTKVQKPNVLGFCIGGTLLASALAVAYARGEDPIESATFLTSMLDFSETGDIACFIDERFVAAREATIGKGGLMHGRELSQVFSALRPNDLIWNYVVDNYLKGNTPTAFDLLYWNSDSTNLSGPFAAYYLRNTYLENNLRVPGKLTMLGESIDLGRINCPSYFVATREDHIVPWRTSFLGRRLVGGESTFVLGASGHIAGVVNPPAKNKRSYWTNATAVATAEEWLESAVEHRGSWWPNWVEWLKARSGDLVAARSKLGSREYRQIEAAPGRYVKERA